MSLAPDLQRLTAVILILSAILLAPGCGGDKYHSAQNQESPAASISGRVVKGVISNGLVKVYPVIGGHMGSSPLVEGATDSNGTYSLQLPQHYLGQVVVQITAQDSASTPSLLTCDVPEGCGKYESYPSAGPVDQDRVAPWGEINYGDKIALDPNDGFELLAVSDSLRAGATTVVDVTALSHLTAKWLLSSDVSDEALVQARNQMADLFNLPANYYKLPPIDLTYSSERKGADATQIQVALISASLLSIASNSPGLSTDPKSAAAGVLEQASTVSSGVTTLLNQLADSYVSLGGQLIGRNASSQNPTPSLLDITNAAFAMAQKISADNTIPPSVVSNFSTIQEKLAQLPVGTATQANAGSVEPAETSQQFFADKVWPLLNQDCTVCHSAGNVASSSALIFEPNQTAAVNFDITKSYILLKTAANDQRGATLFPAKPVGQFGHVGGQIYSSGSSSEAVLVSFVDRILNPGAYPSTTGGSS
ncbi:MAG TPA: hypothetical protein VFM46_02045, partial [Pseudomonadales bacterium]|nr:hypothetical protein [Pseudomonadales bacterium]